MSDRFVEIAAELRELFIAQVSGEAVENEINLNIGMHLSLMIPDGGWPGSNAEARKAAAQKAEATDPIIQGQQARLAYCQEKRNIIKAQIDSLLAERRGLEWQIRRAMVMQMAAQNGASVDFDGMEIDAQPFEAFLDKSASRELFEMPEEPEPEEPEESPQVTFTVEKDEPVEVSPVAPAGNPRPNPFVDVPAEETFQELERRLEAEKQAAAADPVQYEIPF